MENNNLNLKTNLNYISHGETKNPKYLVIFLHGYGSNKENLITLSHHFSSCLPDTLFIAPDAPLTIANNYPDSAFFDDSYKWFSIASQIDDHSFESYFHKSAAEIKESNQILSIFINELLAKFNLDAKKLFLIGFSQGAMMSIYQALTRKDEIAAAISYSGKVILPSALGPYGQNIISKPYIGLFHGKKDHIVTFENFLQSKDILRQLNIPFEAHEFEDLEHHISAEEIEITKKFITKIIS